jgi:hypothetical protein
MKLAGHSRVSEFLFKESRKTNRLMDISTAVICGLCGCRCKQVLARVGCNFLMTLRSLDNWLLELENVTSPYSGVLRPCSSVEHDKTARIFFIQGIGEKCGDNCSFETLQKLKSKSGDAWELLSVSVTSHFNQ